jgi:DNA-binding beta-propeller fold protein YncE
VVLKWVLVKQINEGKFMNKRIIILICLVFMLSTLTYAHGGHSKWKRYTNYNFDNQWNIDTNNNINKTRGNHNLSHGASAQVLAYFGDKKNNQAVVVDVENMKLITRVDTNHKITYALEAIKTNRNKHFISKFYIDNRGSNYIDVFDKTTNKIIKSIKLPFYPRSINIQEETGLVLVSGVNKPMIAVIDSKIDELVAVAGNDIVTYPTTTGHSYLSSGTLSSGHPHWLDREHFVLLDREAKTIVTYKITKKYDDGYYIEKLNEITTPSPVHNLIPPEIHGHKGKMHKFSSFSRSHGTYLSKIFFATAEGSIGTYPSVLKLELLEQGLVIINNLELSINSITPDKMGIHHLNFLKDKKHMYVGSHESSVFVVNYESSPMRVIKILKAGIGAGHLAEAKHNSNISVMINHKDTFITLIDTRTHTHIADIKVSNLSDDFIGKVQIQSHPKYHFSKDGRYFYIFLTKEGTLVKVDLYNKIVVQKLYIGGELSMGDILEH